MIISLDRKTGDVLDVRESPGIPFQHLADSFARKTRVLQLKKNASRLHPVVARLALFFYACFFVMLCEMLFRNLLKTSCRG